MTRILMVFALLSAAIFSAGEALAQTYKIKSGDQLAIEVLEDPSLNRSTLVLPDGRISFPMAGAVRVSGKTIEQVRAELQAALAPNFAAPPTVFVGLTSVAAPRARASSGPAAPDTMDIYVLGEVSKPGKIAVEKGTSILQMFAEMGGFTKFAATKRVQLRREAANGTLTTFQFNYAALERGARLSNNLTLQDGDTIIVPQRRLFE